MVIKYMYLSALVVGVVTSTLGFTATAAAPNKVAETYCSAVPSSPGDRRQNKTTLRVVQYNMEWLFLDYYANSDCPGAGCSWHNQTAAEIHMEYVSHIIQQLNPDIINICEVEGCDELNAVIENTQTSYQPYLIQGKDTSTGQNVGMLTKIDPAINLYRTEERVAYPVPGSKCSSDTATAIASETTTGVSKHYITEFMFGEIHVAMIGLHLLAFPTDPTRCQEREAQAQVIQNVIAKYALANYEIIVLGDFNDFDAEVVDSNINKPTSQVLEIIKGHAGNMAGLYELTNVAEYIDHEDRFSNWWDQNGDCTSTPNEFSMIDHVLVSSTIQEYIRAVFIYHGYTEFCNTYNSDHYPVVVDLANM